MDVGYHLFRFGASSRQVKEQTFADSDPLLPSSCVNICVLRDLSVLCAAPIGATANSTVRASVVQAFPIGSLRVAFSETSLRRSSDSRVCASSLWMCGVG